MKIPLALVALFFASALVRADMVIVQNVDGAGQSGKMTVKINGDKIRTDVTPEVSTITDVKTGEVTTLMHSQKAYMVFSPAASKAMMAQMTKFMQQGGVAPLSSPAPPTATGRTDKINGYNAAEYTFNNGIMKATYWISADFPNAQAVNEALARLRKGGINDLTKAFAPDLSSVPGVPVKTEVELNGQKIVTELVSVKDEAVDPTEYQVPAGYTEVKMPVMPPH